MPLEIGLQYKYVVFFTMTLKAKFNSFLHGNSCLPLTRKTVLNLGNSLRVVGILTQENEISTYELTIHVTIWVRMK
jgi:hypothetical protein